MELLSKKEISKKFNIYKLQFEKYLKVSAEDSNKFIKRFEVLSKTRSSSMFGDKIDML